MPTPTQFVLTDIEGTTTSISFVYDTLFPYFKQHAVAYAQSHLAEPEVHEALSQIADTLSQELAKPITTEEAIKFLTHWTSADRKDTPLKTLQGIVWRDGYAQGALKGHLYPEVASVLQRWHSQGIGLGIYSSGSVEAQKLLFGHTASGNLTPLFSHYFDTRIGHKRETASYHNIAQEIGIAPQAILFLSDVEAELEAAANAGFQVTQILRTGTISSKRFPTAGGLDEISLG
jgi:enolase-phosphatase E1